MKLVTSIIIILVLIILSLVGFCYYKTLKQEGYRPFGTQLERYRPFGTQLERYRPFGTQLERYQSQDIQRMSEDVISYILIPNMTLQELNEFTITNRSNNRSVNRYLTTQFNLPLSTINNLRYFKYRGDDEYPTLPEEVVQELNRNTRRVAEFILTSLFNLFTMLGANYIRMIPFEDQNILVVDYSNLPVFENTLTFNNSDNPNKMLIHRNGLQITGNQEFFNLIQPFFLNLIQEKLNLVQQNDRFTSILMNVNDFTRTINFGFGYYLIDKIGPNQGYNEVLSQMIRERPEIDWLEDEMVD